MKTPCQQLGYKVGDMFEVVGDQPTGFKGGATVTLFEDDGSHSPLFTGECNYRCGNGMPGAYMSLSFVKPLKPKKAKRPWIKWEGGECPVPEGTLIDVKYRDGHKQKGCPVGRTLAKFERNAFFIPSVGLPYNIVAYRLAKPKESPKAEPVIEATEEPTPVQREANGRPVGAKEGDWFRVIKSWYFKPGTVTTLQRDDGISSPFFTDTGDIYPRGVAASWDNMEPCPAPSQPEPEPAKPEWEILWGSEKDFEGAPDWAVYAVGIVNKFWVEDVTPGAKLMRYDVEERVLSTVQGGANYRPYASRRLKQPK